MTRLLNTPIIGRKDRNRRFLKDRYARREVGTASASATEAAARWLPVEPEVFKAPAVHYAGDYYRQLLDVFWACSMPTELV
jgi:hypothetical protein